MNSISVDLPVSMSILCKVYPATFVGNPKPSSLLQWRLLVSWTMLVCFMGAGALCLASFGSLCGHVCFRGLDSRWLWICDWEIKRR